MVGVVLEAGDVDSRFHTRSQVQVDYLTILTLPHLFDCFVCTWNAMSIALLL